VILVNRIRAAAEHGDEHPADGPGHPLHRGGDLGGQVPLVSRPSDPAWADSRGLVVLLRGRGKTGPPLNGAVDGELPRAI
jgi:hypothetical protein